jgi:hypothetical protein
VKCHQRKIREDRALINPRKPMETLVGSRVVPISMEQAKKIILEYEWLGTMPQIGLAYYGLETPEGELVGVVCFGMGSGTNARNVCGEEYRDVTICLERGACVHWAHQHAGSFLVSRACKQAKRDHGWKVFYAYSDETAGEIGTIYQACNWTYIGKGVGRGNGNTGRFVYFDPDGVRWTGRRLRTAMRKANSSITTSWPSLVSIGWTRIYEPDKHKYVLILPNNNQERIQMENHITRKKYPKRN